jgi:nitric oxide reductase NorE protein
MSTTTIASNSPNTTQPLAAQIGTSPERQERKRRVPGEVGIWAFILTDMSVFAIYYIVFALSRSHQPEIFLHGLHLMSMPTGVLNTFFMLTASLFVALAVQYIRQGRSGTSQLLLLGAGLCGTGFVITKYVEWGAKLAAGYTPLSDNFFQLYFILTGIHLLHVVVALVVLAYMSRMVKRTQHVPTSSQIRFIENGASYWHMVDLIWLGLFALFYLAS